MKKIELRMEWLEAIKDLPIEWQAAIIFGMTKYIATGELDTEPEFLAATALMRYQVDADRARREKARQKREAAKAARQGKAARRTKAPQQAKAAESSAKAAEIPAKAAETSSKAVGTSSPADAVSATAAKPSAAVTKASAAATVLPAKPRTLGRRKAKEQSAKKIAAKPHVRRTPIFQHEFSAHRRKQQVFKVSKKVLRLSRRARSTPRQTSEW